jgi:hypothetical protein
MAGVMIKSAVSGTTRARKTKSERGHVAKKQWVAYIAIAVATTLIARLLNDLVEQHLSD